MARYYYYKGMDKFYLDDDVSEVGVEVSPTEYYALHYRRSEDKVTISADRSLWFQPRAANTVTIASGF